MWNGDIQAFLITTIVILVWVEICKFLAHRKLLSAPARRKVVHIFTGPIFICMWPLFGDTTASALWAALVPLSMTVKFFLIGVGVITDEDAVNSVSRSGSRSELLQGPVYYGIAGTLTTVLFFKRVRALLCFLALCCGDGFAEVVGRAYGRSNPLPWSRQKSWAGSIAFAVSTASSVLVMHGAVYAPSPGFEGATPGLLMRRASVCAVMSALVESVHSGEADNLWITAAAALTDIAYCYLFHGSQ